MAEKRYYWLKLEESYFDNPKIKKLRKIAGGDTYTIIYLKLQLLSISNKGIITFEGIENTFEEELALKLDEDVEDIRIGILVDAVSQIIDIPIDTILPVPQHNAQKYVSGMCTMPDNSGTMLVLDCPLLLAN